MDQHFDRATAAVFIGEHLLVLRRDARAGLIAPEAFVALIDAVPHPPGRLADWIKHEAH